MRIRKVLAASVIAFLVLLFGYAGYAGLAQDGEGWAPPIILSEGVLNDAGKPANGFRPVVVGDDWGQVHAFWGTGTDPQRGGMGNAIYYARWDEQGWSGPYDVVFVGDTVTQHAVPRVAVDSDGLLHLIWLRNGTLWYSRASVWQAAYARAWAEPVLVSEGPIPSGDSLVAIATDSEGGVHVLYCLGSSGSVIVHVSSDDGLVWSTPTEITSGIGSRLVNASIDSRDRLHVVYQMTYADVQGVYYTRSEDMGATWSNPVLVDRHDDRYQGKYAPHYINVITYDDQIHIAWHGTPRSQRWHQWSADGGLTWSKPEQISPDLVFLTNPPAMVFDGSGTLHLMSVGASILGVGDFEGTAVFHTTWHDGIWTPLELVSAEADERVDIGIGNGDTLVAVWDNRVLDNSTQSEHFSILASEKKLNSSPLPIAPPPLTPTLAPAAIEAVTPTPATILTPSSEISGSSMENTQMVGSPLPSVLVGSLLAALLVGIVFLLRHPWRREI